MPTEFQRDKAAVSRVVNGFFARIHRIKIKTILLFILVLVPFLELFKAFVYWS